MHARIHALVNGVWESTVFPCIQIQLYIQESAKGGEWLVSLPQEVSNGEWHDVRIKQHGENITLVLDNNFQEILTQPLSLRTTSPLYIGGLPSKYVDLHKVILWVISASYNTVCYHCVHRDCCGLDCIQITCKSDSILCFIHCKVRGRDGMSKVEGLGVHEVGLLYTFILNTPGLGYQHLIRSSWLGPDK